MVEQASTAGELGDETRENGRFMHDITHFFHTLRRHHYRFTKIAFYNIDGHKEP